LRSLVQHERRGREENGEGIMVRVKVEEEGAEREKMGTREERKS